MQNTLYKESKRSYVRGSPGVAGDPGRPYMPARTVYQTRTVCQYVPDQIQLIGLAESSNRAGATDRYYVTSYTYVCTEESYPVYIPEQSYIPPTPPVAAIPSQTIIDYQIGWTGKARSIAAKVGGASARFTIPRATTGAVVGLNSSYQESGYRDIRWAWFVANGIASVMESGVVLHQYGSVTESNELRVDVTSVGARYYVDDALIYQTDTKSDGLLFMDAALYTAGDLVDAPSLIGIAASYGEMLPMIGAGGDGAARGYGAMLPMIGAGGYAIAADGVSPVTSASFGEMLPMIGVGSDRAYAFGYSEMLPMTGYGSGDEVDAPTFAVGEGVMVMMTGYGTGYTIDYGSSEGSMLPMIGLGADRDYASGVGAMLPMVGFGKGAIVGEVQFPSTAAGSSTIQLSGNMLAVFDSSLSGAVLLQFSGGEISAEILSEAIGTVALSLSGTIGATLSQAIIASAEIPDNGAVATWVLNTENNGSTRYEGYDFGGFAVIGGVYYGCREDGIYALDGDDDAGTPIQAMVSFGKQDFGTSSLKRISNAYVGVSSTGKLVLRVIAEGQTYDYVARDAGEPLQTQRFDTGRGLRVNQLEFELYNQGGDDFELSSIEFVVLASSRRV